MTYKTICAVFLMFPVSICLAVEGNSVQSFRSISAQVYKDKMMGAWLGQMVGVSRGAPTEAKALGVIFPLEKIAPWMPDTINESFLEDDLYVEMTFVRSMEQHGIDVSQRQGGIDFANSQYVLWAANNEGRRNLRKGIAPPDSGHPQFNACSALIDYQIESDYSGIIAPGMGQFAIDMGEKFGKLMNYGEGVYGGQFIGSMYSYAYFDSDIKTIISEALKSIPQESTYAKCVRNILKWYDENPDDWQKTWQRVTDAYHTGAGFKQPDLNITAVLNGAYVCVGLLYGKHDPEKTAQIAIQCGQDSDCNPSSALGVLFTTIGYEKIPDQYKSGMDKTKTFSYTCYSYPQLIDVSEKLTRQVIIKNGGSIRKDANENELFLIPNRPVIPSKFESSSHPLPVCGSRYTADEMKLITESEPELGKKLGSLSDMSKYMPGWDCAGGLKDYCGFYESYGKQLLGLVTTPPDLGTCTLSTNAPIPAGKKSKIHVAVAHHFQGNFQLIVKGDGKELFNKIIDRSCSKDYLFETDVDLSAFAGRTIKLELVNQANGLGYKSAYWVADKIKIVSE